MKRTILILCICFTFLSSLTMTAQTPSTEQAKKDILQLVEDTFSQGALNALNYEAMYQGFHPDFAILIPTETNGLFKLPLATWVALVKAYKEDAQQMASGVRNLEYLIDVLDVTDTIALVKVQYFRAQQLIITDYLSYIKFDSRWLAVSKVSKDHITNPLNLNL